MHCPTKILSFLSWQKESLRLLSREADTVHIREANPKDQQRSAAISYWKNWYLEIKPDFVFLDR